jgi:hypothetical protein
MMAFDRMFRAPHSAATLQTIESIAARPAGRGLEAVGWRTWLWREKPSLSAWPSNFCFREGDVSGHVELCVRGGAVGESGTDVAGQDDA